MGNGKRSRVRRGALPAACSVGMTDCVTSPLDALVINRIVIVQTLLGTLAVHRTGRASTLASGRESPSLPERPR